MSCQGRVGGSRSQCRSFGKRKREERKDALAREGSVLLTSSI